MKDLSSAPHQILDRVRIRQVADRTFDCSQFPQLLSLFRLPYERPDRYSDANQTCKDGTPGATICACQDKKRAH